MQFDVVLSVFVLRTIRSIYFFFNYFFSNYIEIIFLKECCLNVDVYDLIMLIS